MNAKNLQGLALAVILIGIAAIQFIPGEAPLLPIDLPDNQRESHRLVNFDRIANFRDMGGYPTADGRHTRWGALYRSGNFSDATPDDMALIKHINAITLIDLRSEYERKRRPNRLPHNSDRPAVVDIPMLDDGNRVLFTQMAKKIDSGDLGDIDPDSLLTHANEQFAVAFVPQFRQLVHSVMDAQGEPVIFHCAAGKDRTGFGAALLLRLLGVPDDIIMQDYMASREPVIAASAGRVEEARQKHGEETAGKLAGLFTVKPEWLKAAFDAIDEHWGSFDQYRREQLGISDSQLTQLREQLLQ